jgi:hypothetical protein
MNQRYPVAFLMACDRFKTGSGIRSDNLGFAFGDNAGADQDAAWTQRGDAIGSDCNKHPCDDVGNNQVKWQCYIGWERVRK